MSGANGAPAVTLYPTSAKCRIVFAQPQEMQRRIRHLPVGGGVEEITPAYQDAIEGYGRAIKRLLVNLRITAPRNRFYLISDREIVIRPGVSKTVVRLIRVSLEREWGPVVVVEN